MGIPRLRIGRTSNRRERRDRRESYLGVFQMGWVFVPLLPPDRQIRWVNKPNTTGFAVSGLDLAIQAERKASAGTFLCAC